MILILETSFQNKFFMLSQFGFIGSRVLIPEKKNWVDGQYLPKRVVYLFFFRIWLIEDDGAEYRSYEVGLSTYCCNVWGLDFIV